MKYEKEINKILHDLIYQDGMTNEEYNMVLSFLLKIYGITMESIDDAIEQGIKMGYSLEFQLGELEKLIKIK